MRGLASLGPKSGKPMPPWQGLGYAKNHGRVQGLCFTPTTELFDHGWPDFSVRDLADWQSSVAPQVEPSIDDCCLVAVIPQMSRNLRLPAGWTYVVHETGGLWREPKRLLVRRLAVGGRGRRIMHVIARQMAGCNIAARYATLDQLLEYRNRLNHHGLDCNFHVQWLAEAFYPIDLAEDAFAILNVENPPSEVVRAIDDATMSLAIMAPNCADI